MRRLWALLLIPLAAAACTDPDRNPPPGDTATVVGTPAEVVEVTDGDSLIVWIEGSEEPVRLIGLNAPERDECFGDESAAGLRDLVAGEQVSIVVDVEPYDQYGRMLAYIYVGDLLINEELARRGYVLTRGYPPNTALQERIDAAAREAQDEQTGLWAPGACRSPAAEMVKVTAVQADPPGPDEENLNGEWVVIANSGPSTVDLSGWVLRDASSVHRFEFPPGSAIEAGAQMVVYTGCGMRDNDELFWCADGPVWGNRGDSALLLDENGLIAADYDY